MAYAKCVTTPGKANQKNGLQVGFNNMVTIITNQIKKNIQFFVLVLFTTSMCNKF